jgi:Ca2+-binding RTX toxin-like protein
LLGTGDDDGIEGGGGSDTVWGGAGNDTVTGGADSDGLDGGEGDDVLFSDGVNSATTTDADTLTGGAGNDKLFGSGTRTYVYGGEGDDWAFAGGRIVEGGGGNDSLTIHGNGDSSVTTVTGGVDNDRLSGGNGADRLTGGRGNDSLTGGAGADDFIFSSRATNGADRITDFAHGIDRLVFSGAEYSASAAFTAGAAASGVSAQFIWDAASGKLYYDADGSGAGKAYELAVFDGGAMVTKDDLFFS